MKDRLVVPSVLAVLLVLAAVIFVTIRIADDYSRRNGHSAVSCR